MKCSPPHRYPLWLAATCEVLQRFKALVIKMATTSVKLSVVQDLNRLTEITLAKAYYSFPQCGGMKRIWKELCKHDLF